MMLFQSVFLYFFPPPPQPELVQKYKEMGILLGKGQNGRVEKIFNEQTGEVKAKKVYIIDNVAEFEEKEKEAEMEKNILMKLEECNNIIKIYEIIREEGNLSIILEFMESDLKKTIENRFKDNPKNYYEKSTFYNYIIQMVNAFAFMQRKNIAHFDIKPENICINSDDTIKIIDLGESVQVDDSEEMHLAGTPIFMSPELLNSFSSDKNHLSEYEELFKIDISIKSKFIVKSKGVFLSDAFSFGLVGLNLANLGLKNLNSDQAKRDSALKEFSLIYPELSYLYGRLLSEDPTKRMDFIQIQDYLLYTFNCPFTTFTPCNNPRNVLNELGLANLQYDRDLPFNKGNTIGVREPLLISKSVSEIFLNLIKTVDFEALKQQTDLKFDEIVKEYMNNEMLSAAISRDFGSGEYSSTVNNFLEKFIFLSKNDAKQIYNPQIDNIYRVCFVPKGVFSENSSKTRLAFISGHTYHWPNFTTAGGDAMQLFEDLKGEVEKKLVENDVIIFKIKINTENRRNKLDLFCITKLNKLDYLLYPYFKFKVMSTSPIQILNRTVLQVDIEEIPQANLPIRILCYDINSIEYEKIKSSCSKYHFIKEWHYAKTITESEQILNQGDPFLIISSGSRGKEFIDKVHDLKNVLRVCLYCFEKGKHSVWFKKEEYKKFLGIFTREADLSDCVARMLY